VTNSIAYAFALRQRIYATIDKKNIPDNLKPGGALWNKLVLWLETFDPVQMRYAGQEWKKLVEVTEQIARATGSVCLMVGISCERKLTMTAWSRYRANTVSNDPTRPHDGHLHIYSS
jgi:hypothetical protein